MRSQTRVCRVLYRRRVRCAGTVRSKAGPHHLFRRSRPAIPLFPHSRARCPGIHFDAHDGLKSDIASPEGCHRWTRALPNGPFDHLVEWGEQRRRQHEAEYLRGLRLIISSNMVSCSMGNSEGLAPFRIRSTKTPRRDKSATRAAHTIRPPTSAFSRKANIVGNRCVLGVADRVLGARCAAEARPTSEGGMLLSAEAAPVPIIPA
jgi:hypothetical protein